MPAQLCCAWPAQVTEKNADVVHDFHQDALKLQLAGDWLKVSCSNRALQFPAIFITPRHTQKIEHRCS